MKFDQAEDGAKDFFDHSSPVGLSPVGLGAVPFGDFDLMASTKPPLGISASFGVYETILNPT